MQGAFLAWERVAAARGERGSARCGERVAVARGERGKTPGAAHIAPHAVFLQA